MTCAEAPAARGGALRPVLPGAPRAVDADLATLRGARRHLRLVLRGAGRPTVLLRGQHGARAAVVAAPTGPGASGPVVPLGPLAIHREALGGHAGLHLLEPARAAEAALAPGALHLARALGHAHAAGLRAVAPLGPLTELAVHARPAAGGPARLRLLHGVGGLQEAVGGLALRDLAPPEALSLAGGAATGPLRPRRQHARARLFPRGVARGDLLDGLAAVQGLRGRAQHRSAAALLARAGRAAPRPALPLVELARLLRATSLDVAGRPAPHRAAAGLASASGVLGDAPHLHFPAAAARGAAGGPVAPLRQDAVDPLLLLAGPRLVPGPAALPAAATRDLLDVARAEALLHVVPVPLAAAPRAPWPPFAIPALLDALLGHALLPRRGLHPRPRARAPTLVARLVDRPASRAQPDAAVQHRPVAPAGEGAVARLADVAIGHTAANDPLLLAASAGRNRLVCRLRDLLQGAADAVVLAAPGLLVPVPPPRLRAAAVVRLRGRRGHGGRGRLRRGRLRRRRR
mmetsp:Transcript_36368/g.104047  ORF Transcript_36368/g.104047 Transcript_36368/m.104047 type:complete len:518 (+) Transcript_36368:2646-4199(+)